MPGHIGQADIKYSVTPILFYELCAKPIETCSEHSGTISACCYRYRYEYCSTTHASRARQTEPRTRARYTQLTNSKICDTKRLNSYRAALDKYPILRRFGITPPLKVETFPRTIRARIMSRVTSCQKKTAAFLSSVAGPSNKANPNTASIIIPSKGFHTMDSAPGFPDSMEKGAHPSWLLMGDGSKQYGASPDGTTATYGTPPSSTESSPCSSPKSMFTGFVPPGRIRVDTVRYLRSFESWS